MSNKRQDFRMTSHESRQKERFKTRWTTYNTTELQANHFDECAKGQLQPYVKRNQLTTENASNRILRNTIAAPVLKDLCFAIDVLESKFNGLRRRCGQIQRVCAKKSSSGEFRPRQIKNADKLLRSVFA